jgi:hypothetical protein
MVTPISRSRLWNALNNHHAKYELVLMGISQVYNCLKTAIWNLRMVSPGLSGHLILCLFHHARLPRANLFFKYVGINLIHCRIYTG